MRSSTGRLRVAAAAALLLLAPGIALAQGPRRVSGSLVYWDQDRGFDAIVAHADSLTEVSPFWYHADSDGQVRPYTTGSGGTYEDPRVLLFLRSHGILTIPTIANIRDGQWNGPLVSRLLADPGLAAAHIRSIVDLVSAREYDGIDIDYEDLAAADRSAFSAFIGALAAALHQRGKLLTVNVYGKTSEPGGWSGPMAQDWSALGASADEVRLMTYEFHWSSSDPGPIAPLPWVQQVLALARATIPADRIVEGVPLYGYDWVGRTGAAQVWDDVMAGATAQRASIAWDAASASPWFDYTSGGAHHTVWFENAMSVEAKLRLAADSGIGGVMLWRLAGEDPAVWPAIRGYFFSTSSSVFTWNLRK